MPKWPMLCLARWDVQAGATVDQGVSFSCPLVRMSLSMVFAMGLVAVCRAHSDCHAVSSVVTGDWCSNKCNSSPPNCPTSMCVCDSPPSPPSPPVPTPALPWDSKTWAVLAVKPGQSSQLVQKLIGIIDIRQTSVTLIRF